MLHTCIDSTMSTTWKQQKEAFVSDHNGGSLIELIAVAGAVVPLCCGARLKLHDAKDSTRSSSRKMPGYWSRQSLHRSPSAPITCPRCLWCWRGRAPRMACGRGGSGTTPTHVIRLFRACQAVFTGICIPAVDFRAFQRASARRRTTGIRLMDMGGLVRRGQRHD